ncbi:MAG: GWxTD domain-containing protein [candidate division Zixibacteria bacterium]|nr:GWxTD domain-containing protein [candidate division Zixibacteria bacterium]MDH3938925.1 GWxTD domain-containing protein [candidate division Zixibacteria bacterium]MDH4035302.1 GWxTD domain-containing protein [candidate division Zixibacteria bacterium]
MIRKVCLWVVLPALLCLVVSQQSVSQSGRLTLYGGLTLFGNPSYDSLSLAEYSFSINRHELEFYQPLIDDSLYYARVFAQIDLFNTRGVVIDSAATFFSVRVKTPMEASQAGFRLFNKVSMYIPPGVYSARLTVIDAASKRRAEVFYNSFTVVPPVTDYVSLSGVTFAHDITAIDDSVVTDRRMVRNGFKVVPNPISTFNTDDWRVNLYAEAYNLSFLPDQTSQVEVALSVLNIDSSLYMDIQKKSLDNRGTSAVITEAFGISDWPPGVYICRLIVNDMSSSQADTVDAAFQIVSVEQLAIDKNARKAFDPYDTLSLQSRVRLVYYRLTPVEKQTLSSLGDKAKLNYLEQYWKEHDDYPETPEVENRLELIELFDDANRLYSVNPEKTDGWNTHLGRVLMQYGRPSEIEDKTAEWVNALPMQIWYYWELEEGKFFLFADTRHDFDFKLVHSNVEGEVYDKNWQAIIDAGWVDVGFSPFGED